jgi:3-dehydroquinate synthase II
LEKGVGHILIHDTSSLGLKKILTAFRSAGETIRLETAEILTVQSLGMGDRVCVDTCTMMTPGQGMLVGNSSSGLFLVHSECIANPYVSPRPFRVNAGPVHAYTRIPGGKTRYLSELASGDEVMIVDFKGNTVSGIVGRLKIEKRPLMLITANVGNNRITTIVQNAETIRLVSPEGDPISVVSLKTGNTVLAALESSGRHFGHKIEETITEK